MAKTTLIDTILRILGGAMIELRLCAPTGRAARRMSESTGMEATMIHRLLEGDPANGSFKRDAHNRLDCDLLVVDEASMVDVRLRRALLAAVPDKAALLIVGDTDQSAVGRTRTGARRPDRLGRRPGRAADRGLPPRGAKPDRDHRARDQPRGDPRPPPAGSRQRPPGSSSW